MVLRFCKKLIVGQENHRQDPEEFYVKQDRIGTQILRTSRLLSPVPFILTPDLLRRQGIIWRGLQRVSYSIRPVIAC